MKERRRALRRKAKRKRRTGRMAAVSAGVYPVGVSSLEWVAWRHRAKGGRGVAWAGGEDGMAAGHK